LAFDYYSHFTSPNIAILSGTGTGTVIGGACAVVLFFSQEVSIPITTKRVNNFFISQHVLVSMAQN
jgi:hypothetical protein